MYGLCKVQKTFDVCPPFRPILSATGAPACKIAKFLVLLLNCLTIDGFNIEESFSFDKEIVELFIYG